MKYKYVEYAEERIQHLQHTKQRAVRDASCSQAVFPGERILVPIHLQLGFATCCSKYLSGGDHEQTF